jgi:hypothetical protein
MFRGSRREFIAANAATITIKTINASFFSMSAPLQL